MKIPLSALDLPERDLRASIDEDALDELAASLRDHGQLQPIGVRPICIDPAAAAADLTNPADLDAFVDTGGRFEVVFGSRRTRAARLNHWKTIDVNFVSESTQADYGAKKLIENVQRLDMTPIEEAYGLADLIGDAIPNLRELQRQTGKSREWIRSRIELMDLHDDLQGAVQAGAIGIGVAREFGRIENDTVRTQYIRAAIENGCTATQAAIWASQAPYAATGIMTMDEIQATDGHNAEHQPASEQQMLCFICTGSNSWRRVNTLIICKACQDAITSSRHTYQAPAMPSPLDNILELD